MSKRSSRSASKASMVAEDTKKSAEKDEPKSKTPVKDVPLANEVPSKRVKK